MPKIENRVGGFMCRIIMESAAVIAKAQWARDARRATERRRRLNGRTARNG